MHQVSGLPQDLMEAELSREPGRRGFAAEPGQVRCECFVCGAHAFAAPDVDGSGRCGSCGSQDLRPLAA